MSVSLFDRCLLDPVVLLDCVQSTLVPLLKQHLVQHPLPLDVNLDQFDGVAFMLSECQERGSYAVVGWWYLLLIYIYVYDEEENVLFEERDKEKYKAFSRLVQSTLQNYLEGNPLPFTLTSPLPLSSSSSSSSHRDHTGWSISRVVESLLQQYMLL